MTWTVLLVALLWLGYAALGRRWRIAPRLDLADATPKSARTVAVVPAFVTFTSTPGNTAPEESRTVPDI